MHFYIILSVFVKPAILSYICHFLICLAIYHYWNILGYQWEGQPFILNVYWACFCFLKSLILSYIYHFFFICLCLLSNIWFVYYCAIYFHLSTSLFWASYNTQVFYLHWFICPCKNLTIFKSSQYFTNARCFLFTFNLSMNFIYIQSCYLFFILHSFMHSYMAPHVLINIIELTVLYCYMSNPFRRKIYAKFLGQFLCLNFI